MTQAMAKEVVIRLTPEEAKHVWLNADGWIDAGACQDGLSEGERSALLKLCEQILKQIKPRKRQ